MAEIFVAGVSAQRLPESVQRILESSPCHLVCSQSMLDLVKQTIVGFDESNWIPVTPLGVCFSRIEALYEAAAIVILTSGDPLFYGIGKRLKERFPNLKIRFLPAVSSMQTCFARFGMVWQDAEFISLHGRDMSLLDTKLNAEKLFIFTDPKNTPTQIARHLMSRLSEDELAICRLHVGVCLGTENEQLVSGAPIQIAGMQFSQPNCLIYQNPKAVENSRRYRFGLNESEIDHSRGLITKDEVRSTVIHRLQLPDRGVFWDVGAGSGSIGIEAARLHPALLIYAIEKSSVQLSNIERNKKRYQCRNLIIASGSAPHALADLPRPDRVFVGGSGGALDGIIAHLAQVVAEDGIVVVTAVLEQTAQRGPELLHRHGFTVDISEIQVVRRSYPAEEKTRLNTIHIIRGCRNR
jgi:precorrin-6Y C5,15-methyltransferase (decarboxylating)